MSEFNFHFDSYNNNKNYKKFMLALLDQHISSSQGNNLIICRLIFSDSECKFRILGENLKKSLK